jgi:sensor histidine kinase YesM
MPLMNQDDDKERIDESWKRYFGIRHLALEFFYLLIIDTAIAVFLSAAGITHPFSVNLVMSQCYGISIFVIVHVFLLIFKPKWGTASAFFILFAGIATGYLAGHYLAFLILSYLLSMPPVDLDTGTPRQILLALVICCVVGYFYFTKAKLKASVEAAQQERITRLSVEKEALEARLRLLQAQIEPHFLFNTLSNVLSLIDADPARGKTMLSDLIHYLRTSLSRTRPSETTLDQEMDVCTTYLKIQKVRMGDRLSFEIETPESLRHRTFPPMLIQPLVENALKHGLEPRVEGGSILVKTTEEDNLLRIVVADTGDGFSEYERGGIGISNVRERLKLLFGDKARLLLEENKPHGVRAIVEVSRDGL